MKKYRVSENHEFLKPGLEFSELDLVPIKINELFRNDTAWAAHRDNPTWFEEIDSRWKPELGERYWVFNSHGDVYDFKWSGNSGEEQMYSMGNCFPSRESAEQARDKVKELLLSLK